MFSIVIKQINIFVLLFILIVLFVFADISYISAQTLSVFPQYKVNKTIFEHWQNKVRIETKQSVNRYPSRYGSGKSCISLEKVILPNRKDFEAAVLKNILYIGPGPDTFFINSNYVQNGDIIIFGEGVLVVDNAMLTLSGQLYAQDRGQAIFRNNAHLHFNQFYVGQYFVWLVDSAKFEATDATVDANGVMHYAQLHDNCTYIARNTSFPDWTFRKVFNHASLILEDVNHVGDIMVDDSCFVHFTRCDTLMPWFQTPDGSIINIQFPAPDFVDHFELSEATPGVDGIGYTFIVDSCSQCWWSLETLPGCNVTITNSTIRGSCVRMFGSDTFNITGIENYTYHSNLTVPLNDRQLKYINTYVYWWNWYPFEDIVFNIDSCSFGEMIGRGNSKTHATNCIHDGATIMLGSGGNAFVSFADGSSYSYVGTFQNSTFLFINSSIIPLWPYQSTNIAHDNSYLLAVNSYFDYEPFAMDSALVMFTAIDSPSVAAIEDTVGIFGSAWIDAGPQSPITFDRYKLHWSTAGDSIWTLIKESTDTVHHDILALWNTSGLSAGEYDLRLMIWDSAGDSLTAFKRITLQNSIGINNKDGILPESIDLFQNYPNPFNPQTTIDYQLPTKVKVILKIYNILGEEIRTLVDGNIPAGKHSIVWNGKNNSGVSVTSGIYFYKLEAVPDGSQAGNYKETKKMLFIK